MMKHFELTEARIRTDRFSPAKTEITIYLSKQFYDWLNRNRFVASNRIDITVDYPEAGLFKYQNNYGEFALRLSYEYRGNKITIPESFNGFQDLKDNINQIRIALQEAATFLS